MDDAKTSWDNFLNRLSALAILISGLAILVITLLISFDVLMRYFLDQPQLFVDELTSFFLVAVIFLGTGPTFWKGGHIQVDLLTTRLRSKIRSRLRVLTLFIGILLLGIVIYETFISTLVAFQLGRVSAVMLYPLWMAMFFIPFGLTLMAFFMAVNMIREIKGKQMSGGAGAEEISGENLP
jgi:TRAP-type transport system small permease protein